MNLYLCLKDGAWIVTLGIAEAFGTLYAPPGAFRIVCPECEQPMRLITAEERLTMRPPVCEPSHTQERDQNSARADLSPREQEILMLMRTGHKNREIARILDIADSTVHKHIANMFEKLHVRNRVEALYLTAGKEKGTQG